MEEVLLVVMEMNERSSIQEMSFRWSDSSLTARDRREGFFDWGLSQGGRLVEREKTGRYVNSGLDPRSHRPASILHRPVIAFFTHPPRPESNNEVET